MLDRIKRWAMAIKGNVMVLYIAARDTRTPLPAKLVAFGLAAYALSPIDLIPDFIPVLGYLDDLILLPLGIALAIRLIPTDLITEFRLAAELRGRVAPDRIAGAVVIVIWLAGLLAFALWLLQHTR